MVKLRVDPISPVVGAEVHGVDLAEGVNDTTFNRLHRAFLDHGVLFFRGQSELPLQTHVDFASRLGELHIHPTAPAEHEHPAVFVVHTHEGSPISNGNGWHSDVSCEEEPPLATMLQLRMLPDSGGDTLFSCMETAYASLSPSMQKFLGTLTARHASEHVYRGRYADRGVDDIGRIYPEAIHPMIRTHAETGRRSIYVNPSFTVEICELEPSESHGLLNWLFGYLCRPEFQIRHRWKVHDVALWDNRRLQHFAIWDYWPDERIGHRVSIKGERPFFDPSGVEPVRSPLRLSSGRLK